MNFSESASNSRFPQDFRKYYIGKRLTCQATEANPRRRIRPKFLLLFLWEMTANDSILFFCRRNWAIPHFPYRIEGRSVV